MKCYHIGTNIFLVPKNSGGFRPFINLKPLNQFVEKIHFKMENIQLTSNAINQGDSDDYI